MYYNINKERVSRILAHVKTQIWKQPVRERGKTNRLKLSKDENVRSGNTSAAENRERIFKKTRVAYNIKNAFNLHGQKKR